MKHFKKIEEIKTINKLEKITCDICGQEFKPEVGDKEGITYDLVEFSHTKGYVYESYGDFYDGRANLELDICGKCFKEKIKPFLRSLGVNLQYKDFEEDNVEDPDTAENNETV